MSDLPTNLVSLAGLPVKELAEESCPSISHSESVSKLIWLLQESGSYEALVLGSPSPRLVTVRDILKVAHPVRTSVSKIAFRPPSVVPDDPIHDASLKLVRNKIRILPMVKSGRVVGVIRQTKILEAIANCEDLKFTCEELMVEDPITVTGDSSVGSVRSIMLRRGISYAPVVDESGKLKGMLTARELVWHYVKPRESLGVGEMRGEKVRIWGMGIRGLAEKDPLSVPRRASIHNAVQMMVTRGKGYCLVLEKNKPIGIITPREVISLLAELRPKAQIPISIIGLKGADETLLQSARRKILRVAARGLKIHPDILEIVVHGKGVLTEGKRRGFTLKVRVFTPTKVLSMAAKGWSLLVAFDQLCERMDRVLRRALDKKKQ